MTILSPVQITQYAYNAGFRGQALINMVAIAMAESGGNTLANNPNDPFGGSFGLVQINGAHFHPGGTSLSCAYSPSCAMQYAFMLSGSGHNFQPWGTWTNGSAGALLQKAAQAVQQSGVLTGTPQLPQNQLGQLAATVTNTATSTVAAFPTAASHLLTPVTLQPNANLTDLLSGIDDVELMPNPFDITPVQDSVTIFGNTINFIDPTAYAGQFGLNLMQDMTGFVIRAILVIIGVVLVYKVVISFVDLSAAQDTAFQAARLSMVGGMMP